MGKDPPPKKIPRRFKAEKLDKVLFLMRMANDIQLHCVIVLDRFLDVARMQRAVQLSLEAEPILACRFVKGKWRQYWEQRADLDWRECVRLVQANNIDLEIGNYLAAPISHLEDPLLQVRIFRSTTDTLCVKMNHMVADAGGVKDYVCLLAEIYRGLAANQDFRPEVNGNGTRSPRQLWRHFSFLDRLRILRRGFRDWKSELVPRGNWCYPFVKAPAAGRMFVIRRLVGPDRFPAIRQYAKLHGVTINDIMAAAVFRALRAVLQPAHGMPMRLGTTVDLRRHLPGNKADGICNLSGLFKLNAGTELGMSLADTIQLVHGRMRERKADCLGLGDCRFFMFGGMLPYPWAVWVFKLLNRFNRFLSGPEVSPGLTNMGEISREQVDFGEAKTEDAFLAPPLVFPPFFVIGLSGFAGSITMSAGFCESAVAKTAVAGLFDTVEKELAELF